MKGRSRREQSEIDTRRMRAERQISHLEERDERRDGARAGDSHLVLYSVGEAPESSCRVLVRRRARALEQCHEARDAACLR